jgi:DNA-directed RNA polymerase specialized sigma subunit
VALCKEVELWIEQDQVGSNSKMVMGNSSDQFGDSLSFVDIARIKMEGPIERDEKASEEAWKKIKSLNLKPHIIEFIDLYYRQGLRNCEIAVRIGASDQTVNVRHKAARAIIKERLSREAVYSVLKWVSFDGNKFFQDVLELYFNQYLNRTEIARRLGTLSSEVSSALAFILGCYKILDTESRVEQ